MKTLHINFTTISCLLLICFFNTQLIAGSEKSHYEIADKTMQPYFEALKNGDVILIKQQIAGKMLQRNKSLLEKNKTYPDFLRNYYKDVEFQIEAVKKIGDDILVSIILLFPGNESVKSGYVLRSNKINSKSESPKDKVWKIIRQVEK